jgi:hypothetical protein
VSKELFEEAIRLEEEGQNERALSIWVQLAETEPTRNVFYIGIGQAMWRHRR